MIGEHVSCRLPATARSVTDARHFVLDALSSWGRDELADTAALLTSEVVTNAVLHARTAMDVVVRLIDDGVVVEVTDGSRHSPRGRQPTLDSTTGRGLDLLDRLATAWDVQILPSGKVVRFTLKDGVDPWTRFTGHDWAVDR
jgi:anti-sigma regulatory factor (Ser/Thr protein kinase)